jgi:hypothetical protein
MTVYGSEPRGTHVAVKVLVGLAAVVLLAAVVVVWRSAAGDEEPAAGAATGPAPPSSSPTPATSKVSSPPAKLSTGSWLLSIDGGYLGFDGDYATLSSSRGTSFDVVKGLADASCFSIRAAGGKYLRHFDYRLRFDKPDGSDLNRQDATFCPLDGVPAGVVRLRSVNYPDHVIHRRDKKLYIDERDDTDAFEADSSFTLEKA